MDHMSWSSRVHFKVDSWSFQTLNKSTAVGNFSNFGLDRVDEKHVPYSLWMIDVNKIRNNLFLEELSEIQHVEHVPIQNV